jgi:hypothetical protein
MNTDVIDKAFSELIHQREIHTQLGISSGNVRNIRYKLAKGLTVSTDTKLKLLQLSGWRQDEEKYNRADLVSLLNFYAKTSQAARDQGPEYVIEKWEGSRK